jgi:hypothetical protein
MKEIYSHIQITKSLLGGFSHNSNEGRKVFYFDIQDKKIKEEKISKLGTEKGYYSGELEEYLNKNIESKIGDVAKRFKEFGKQKDGDLIITSEDNVNIKRFFLYSLIRSSLIVRHANKASIIAPLLGGYKANDVIPFIINNKIDDPFENYFTNILLNESSVEFVIPRNCIYSLITHENPTRYILPINPKVAFILMHEKEIADFNCGDKSYYLKIDSDDLVKDFNKRALFDEIQFNNQFVVAKRKRELEDLQIYYKDNKIYLENKSNNV